MEIVFVDWLPRIHVGIIRVQVNGVAVCPCWENSENGCRIIVSSNVVRNYPDVQFSKNYTADLLAHEIGHVLGFMHTDEQGDIMHGSFGDVFDQIYDQEQVFAVPERHAPHN